MRHKVVYFLAKTGPFLMAEIGILYFTGYKSRKQMNEKVEKQEKKASILGKIKDYQKNDKSNDLAKKENKGQER